MEQGTARRSRGFYSAGHVSPLTQHPPSSLTASLITVMARNIHSDPDTTIRVAHLVFVISSLARRRVGMKIIKKKKKKTLTKYEGSPASL